MPFRNVAHRAQAYLDFGYARRFKERHPIEGYACQQRYTCRRLDAQGDAWERSPIRRTTYPRLPDRWMPLLPRWAWK